MIRFANQRGMATRRGGYFNMIDDSLITPSTRASNLNESYFKERATKILGQDALKDGVKSRLKDVNSGVYFNPVWNETLAIDDLKAMLTKIDDYQGRGLAWDALNRAKASFQNAVNALGGRFDVTTKTARERVEQAIRTGRLSDDLKTDSVKNAVKDSIASLNEWVILQTAGEAYANEINRRLKMQKDVDTAITRGDVDELKALLPKIKVTELKDKVNNAITTIEESKKAEEERKKAEEEARKKLAEAKTDEEKKSAQAELDAVLGRVKGDVKSALGNKTLIYVGIGLVVLVGAYFVFKKRAQ